MPTLNWIGKEAPSMSHDRWNGSATARCWEVSKARIPAMREAAFRRLRLVLGH